MSRAVLADHVLFNECVYYLREDLHKKNQGHILDKEKQTFSCLSTTFHITKPWIFEKFTIYPSVEVILPAAKKSLLNFVKNPSWVNEAAFDHPHLFGEALSALISFVTLRSVKSPRDGYGLRIESLENISGHCLEEMAFTLPFLCAGPGAHDSRLEDATEDQFIKEIQELISNLEKLDENLYVFALEVIRLVQLSTLVKRDDFGLAYLLLISAIEAVSQKAIKRKSKKHEKEKEWEQLARSNPLFKELLDEYKDIRGRDKYLSDRFIEFIVTYSPSEEWENIVKSRYAFMDREWNDFMQRSKHPSKMHKEEIENILKNAYQYRSRFVHEGTQPPHKHPEASFNKFFEVIETYDPISYHYKSELCPTYELMLGIAKIAISKWIKSKAMK